MAPAIDLAKERPILQLGDGQPILDCFHRAQPGQCRAGKAPAFQLPIALAAWQVTGGVSEFGKNRTLSERLATRDAIVKHFVIYGILLKLA